MTYREAGSRRDRSINLGTEATTRETFISTKAHAKESHAEITATFPFRRESEGRSFERSLEGENFQGESTAGVAPLRSR